LGERLDRTQEVGGSSPPSSIDRAVYRASYFRTCAIANRASGHIGRDEHGVLSDNPEVQIREAFRSVGRTLAEVGATWADVVEMTSYHVGLQVQKDAILRVHREFIREPPYPAWTATGVTELFSPNAVFELSVVAVLPEGALFWFSRGLNWF
jgi:enamine deaminase RidA (YjgF/YER057c/UK114 family)